MNVIQVINHHSYTRKNKLNFNAFKNQKKTLIEVIR